MSLILYGHPFSSYTQKVLIALWANETPFDYRIIDEEHPQHRDELARHSPFNKFPLLIDDGVALFETTAIIDHLDAHHPGKHRWIPEGDIGRRVRFLDRFFDLYVMEQMTVAVFDALRPADQRDPFGVKAARDKLRTAYDWLDANLGSGPYAVGTDLTLADCAAAPALFYADWVDPIGHERPVLKAYRATLLAHPTVMRAVDEGRPYRHFFPLGAPDRD
jgi:glutathione S-transferase